jgi:hypothetical protein
MYSRKLRKLPAAVWIIYENVVVAGNAIQLKIHVVPAIGLYLLSEGKNYENVVVAQVGETRCRNRKITQPFP